MLCVSGCESRETCTGLLSNLRASMAAYTFKLRSTYGCVICMSARDLALPVLLFDWLKRSLDQYYFTLIPSLEKSVLPSRAYQHTTTLAKCGVMLQPASFYQGKITIIVMGATMLYANFLWAQLLGIKPWINFYGHLTWKPHWKGSIKLRPCFDNNRTALLNGCSKYKALIIYGWLNWLNNVEKLDNEGQFIHHKRWFMGGGKKADFDILTGLMWAFREFVCCVEETINFALFFAQLWTQVLCQQRKWIKLVQRLKRSILSGVRNFTRPFPDLTSIWCWCHQLSWNKKFYSVQSTLRTRKSSNRTCDGRVSVEPPLLEIYRRYSESLVINLQVFSKVASKDKVKKRWSLNLKYHIWGEGVRG